MTTIDLSLISSTLNNPVTALTIPFIHYHYLIKSQNGIITTLPFIIFNIMTPLMFRSDSANLMNSAAGFFYLAITLRFIDIAQLPQKITQKLTLTDYMEYLLAFELNPKYQPLVSQKVEPDQQKNMKVCARVAKTVQYEDLTANYFQSLFFKTVFKLAIYESMVCYLLYYRRNWIPKPFELFYDFWSLLDCYIYGVSFSIGLDIAIVIFSHSNSLIFKVPYVPVMNHPYLSTSVRQFWGERWNLIIQTSLRRAVFNPVIKMFGYDSNLSTRTFPAWLLILASFSTFVFSAIMHEWFVFILCDLPTTGEQLVFFTLHGIICILEVVGRKAVQKTIGVDIASIIPTWLQIIYATSIVVFTSPWFLNPLVRENVLLKIDYFYDKV
ncbi:hypothetical protein HDV02_006637 [Globomyces sp. JEL0801]|nr:hypothetical protein HDV02_006637 [Globomyces sp. JEL0801]